MLLYILGMLFAAVLIWFIGPLIGVGARRRFRACCRGRWLSR